MNDLKLKGKRSARHNLLKEIRESLSSTTLPCSAAARISESQTTWSNRHVKMLGDRPIANGGIVTEINNVTSTLSLHQQRQESNVDLI